MNYCGAWSLVKDEDGLKTAVPLRCHSWSCPYCAPRLKKRLFVALRGTDATTLLTLTCNPARWPSPAASFRPLSVAINHLVKRIRRLCPSAEFEYFAIWESTKRGWPHVHIIFRGPFLPQQWVSQQWYDLTGAPIVDVRFLHSPSDVTSYIASYLAKEPSAPKGFKRYRSSRHFFKNRPAAEVMRPHCSARWTIVQASPLAVAQGWDWAQMYVVPLGGGAFLGIDAARMAGIVDRLRSPPVAKSA